MAVPKNKISKTRGRNRRAHLKLEKPSLIRCPQCHEFMMSHRVCKSCGYYKGKEVVNVE